LLILLLNRLRDFLLFFFDFLFLLESLFRFLFLLSDFFLLFWLLNRSGLLDRFDLSFLNSFLLFLLLHEGLFGLRLDFGAVGFFLYLLFRLVGGLLVFSFGAVGVIGRG